MVIVGGLGSIWGAVLGRPAARLHQLLPDPGRAQQPAEQVRAALPADRGRVRDLRVPAGAGDAAAAAGPAAGAKTPAGADRRGRRTEDAQLRGAGGHERGLVAEPTTAPAVHDARRRRDQGVRRPGRRRRRLAGRAPPLDRLADRAERRRQDDAVQHADRAVQADRRADRVRRARHHARPARPRSPASASRGRFRTSACSAR